MQDLEEKGFKIITVTNILKRKEKTPLLLFMLTFENSEDINRIHQIKQISGVNVAIEPLQKSGLVPQCKRCQEFGHTKNQCHREVGCVKCAGKHLTRKCTNSVRIVCANCGQSYPASYRGCEDAKQIQKMRNKTRKIKKLKY